MLCTCACKPGIFRQFRSLCKYLKIRFYLAKINLFIYLYNFANEQTAHYIHKYRQLAGTRYSLRQLRTAALYINTSLENRLRFVTF